MLAFRMQPRVLKPQPDVVESLVCTIREGQCDGAWYVDLAALRLRAISHITYHYTFLRRCRISVHHCYCSPTVKDRTVPLVLKCLDIDDVITLVGTTNRFKTKYVTTVLYKPFDDSVNTAAAGASADAVTSTA